MVFRRRQNKYGVAPKSSRTMGGRTYASRREMEVASDLLLEKNVGRIKKLVEQPRYELIPKPNRISYVPDFYVEYDDGSAEVIEVKGCWTQVAILKVKMFRHFYPDIMLRIVK